MSSNPSEIDYDINSYDYILPENMIAQTPVEPRDSSKLMVLSRNGFPIADDITRNLKQYISANTVIVLNDVKVIPGRFYTKKSTGGKVEVLILSILDENSAEVLLQSRRPIRKGDCLFYSSDDVDFSINILSDPRSGGIRIAQFTNFNLTPENLLKIGLPPLPPYIKRDENDSRFENDKSRYQTIYAENGQAAAAPTAGLHFTQEMINDLANDFEMHKITLNVGLGTFQPVHETDIRQHLMHNEYFKMSQDTAIALQTAKSKGRQILAIGTTTVRTLESIASHDFNPEFLQGETDIFIYPGYNFKLVNSIMTNFHLPKSTLIMMIAAFIGRENILNAYESAIKKDYRFYSYGDAMLLQSI